MGIAIFQTHWLIWLLYIPSTIGILFLLCIIWFYKRSDPDEALIKTGCGGLKINIDGGFFVFPILNKIKTISLATIPVTIECLNKESLISKDYYRVDLKVNLSCKVDKDHKDIEKIIRSLGKEKLNAAFVKKMLQDRLIGILRIIIFNKTLHNLYQSQQELTNIIFNGMKDKIKDNGLTLENVAITYLEPAKKEIYDENNIFDAQALKNMAIIIEKEREEKDECIQNANLSIAKKIMKFSLR